MGNGYTSQEERSMSKLTPQLVLEHYSKMIKALLLDLIEDLGVEVAIDNDDDGLLIHIAGLTVTDEGDIKAK